MGEDIDVTTEAAEADVLVIGESSGGWGKVVAWAVDGVLRDAWPMHMEAGPSDVLARRMVREIEALAAARAALADAVAERDAALAEVERFASLLVRADGPLEIFEAELTEAGADRAHERQVVVALRRAIEEALRGEAPDA